MANRSGYQNLYQKVKRRDAKIVALKEIIESMKRYITKIGARSRGRKFATEKAKRELKDYKQLYINVVRFIRLPINKRSYNIMDLLLRVAKVQSSVYDELTPRESVILIYLYNIETVSTTKLAKDVSLSKESITDRIFDLSKKEMLISKRAGKSNYIYITEEGRRAVRTFVDLIAKQEFNILDK